MSLKPIQILIVDDHRMVREGLSIILKEFPDLSVCAEAHNTTRALVALARHKPDVVLLDLRLSDGSGIEACRQIKAASPSTRVLVLTSFGDRDTVLNAIGAGADGYLLKDVKDEELASAIRRVASGQSIVAAEVTRQLLDHVKGQASHAAPTPLTAQEQRLLALLADGRTNKEIAAVLNLSEKTVRNYLTVILDKLGVQNRVQAVAHYLRYKQK